MKKYGTAFLVIVLVFGNGLLDAEEISLSRDVHLAPILEVLDLVTTHHIDPPAPQHFALKVARNYLALTGNEPQPTLIQKTWALSSKEHIAKFLQDLEKAFPDQSKRSPDLVWAKVFKSIPIFLPTTMIRRTRDAKVEESFSSNRYVGIGIALATGDDYPAMRQIMEGGAAEKAGAVKGDHIYSINGQSTKDWDLQKTVDQLRGKQGSELILEIGTDSNSRRKRTLVREVVPFKTVSLEKGYPGYAVVEVSALRSSTVSEIRKLKPKWAHYEGIILDLRKVRGGRVHDAVLLANALMDGGTIGKVRTVDGVRGIDAEPERVFGDLPVAMLVSNHSDLTAWIAFAVNREKQAATVFSGPFSELIATRYFEIPGTDYSISLPYCRLEGPKGPEKTRGAGHGIVSIAPTFGKKPIIYPQVNTERFDIDYQYSNLRS